MKRELLIATSNEGKVKEILHVLGTTPFLDVKTLADLDVHIEPPEETTGTIEGNALQKAKYYAKETGMLVLADDSGLFIDALDGWPGVDTALVPGTFDEKMTTVLDKLKNHSDRSASFRCIGAIYDPLTKNAFLSEGKVDGNITTEQLSNGNGFGYDPIFFSTDLKKTFAEATQEEKQSVSHRGRAMQQVKYFLQNTFGSKHIVVPFSLVIKDGKVLMIKRSDPHRPEYHEKWEFPGGTVEAYESMHANVMRETEEETGLVVQVQKTLQHIATETQVFPTFQYQVFLVPYVCTIVSGSESTEDHGTLDIEWFDLDDVLNHELVGENGRVYTEILPELKQYIVDNNL